MKSILDRLKNHAAQSLRLIIIRVNGTARFRVAYSSPRNHRLFFPLHYPSHSSETVGRQKMGALVWAGGYSNLQGEMNERQKSIHWRTWLRASSRENRSGDFSRSLSSAFWARRLNIFGNKECDARQSSPQRRFLSLYYVCVAPLMLDVTYVALTSKTCRKIRRSIITGFNFNNKCFYHLAINDMLNTMNII